MQIVPQQRGSATSKTLAAQRNFGKRHGKRKAMDCYAEHMLRDTIGAGCLIEKK